MKGLSAFLSDSGKLLTSHSLHIQLTALGALNYALRNNEVYFGQGQDI